jgi:hypothetical protein
MAMAFLSITQKLLLLNLPRDLKDHHPLSLAWAPVAAIVNELSFQSSAVYSPDLLSTGKNVI